MTSVITADLINSKKESPAIWLKTLKKELANWGETPKQWEIYRGDSFQIEIPDHSKALRAAVQIKAAVKVLKSLDVRMAIGIGEKSYRAKKITESNGSAFVHSGELAEELKKLKLNLAIRSDHPGFDEEINLYIKLALSMMNRWTGNAAETIHAAMQNPGMSQEELGKLLGIKQNAVSTRLKRAGYDEIMEVISMFESKIRELK